MLFGWDRVKPTTHYVSTILVSLGATFSATWIVMANSWMQTPDGFKVIGEGIHKRAVITDLWSVYFNPSFLTRIGHVLLGCGILGAFLLFSISAYYMVRRRHEEFAKFNIKVSMICGLILLLLQLWSADSSAKIVEKYQPVKFAAMEAVFKTENSTPMSLIGIVDVETETVHGISVPGLLSFLTYHNFTEAVKGLNEFPKEDWPHIPSVFYSYHVMIYAWGAMMLYTMLGVYFLWRKTLEKHRWFLWISPPSIFLPYVANLAGWFTAETGRQPWIVQGVMRTSEGISKVVSAQQIFASLIMFVAIFSLLFILFIFLLNRKVQHGPVHIEEEDSEEPLYRDPYTTKAGK